MATPVSYSGMRSYRVAFFRCGAHGCAERVQISAVGLNQDVSSIVLP